MNERRDWAPVDWSPMKRLIYLRGNPATGGGGSPLTVSGPTPLLMPGALAKPLKKATFQISPVQSGSGDPSPSNVRPITGWTAANVYLEDEYSGSATPKVSITFPAMGKNVFDTSKCTIGATAFGLTSTVSGDYVKFTGTCTSGGSHRWKFLTVNTEQRELAQTLSYSAFMITAGTGILITDIILGDDNNLYIVMDGLVTNQQYEFYIGIVGYTGTAPTAFEPYSNTIYSGTIDPVTGQGVVTHKKLLLSNIGWRWITTASYFVTTKQIEDAKTYPGYYMQIGWMSNVFKAGTTNSAPQTNNEITCTKDNSAVRVRMDEYANDMEGFIGYLASSGAELLYPLATPIPFSVPPQAITPPAGDAYIWADCGSSAEVTYIGKA